MTRRWTMCVLAALAACDAPQTNDSAGPAPRTSGDTIVVDAMIPACASCTLTTQRITVLGSADDRETFRHLPDIVRDSRGNYYAPAHGWSNDLVLRYDAGGRYLGILGARGDGPGEYRMTSGLFVAPGDSVYVSTWSRRVLVFGPDGVFARSFQLTHGARPIGVVPGAGALYAAGNMMGWTRDLPIFAHVLGADGTPRDSFEVFSSPVHIPRTPVVGDDGNLWTWTDRHFRLEAHAADGRTLRVLGARTPAFPNEPLMTRPVVDSLRGARGNVRVAQRPSREDLLRRDVERVTLQPAIDREGLVWVATTIPAPDWGQKGVEMMKESDEAPGENLLAPDDDSALRHTVVEVLDAAAGRLLARTELPFGAQMFAPGLLARPVTDATGHLRMEIYRVTLSRDAASR